MTYFFDIIDCLLDIENFSYAIFLFIFFYYSTINWDQCRGHGIETSIWIKQDASWSECVQKQKDIDNCV